KHGFRSAKVVIILENVEEYEDLHQRLAKDWKPQRITERLEVRRLAQAHWQLQRAYLALTESLDTEICQKLDGVTERQLQKTIRTREKLDNSDRSELDAKENRKLVKVQAAYSNLILVQERVRKTMSSNVFGVGAALSRLGGSDDKLGTIL